MGARSSNWRARLNETSVFDGKGAAPETSFFRWKERLAGNEFFDEKSAAPKTSAGLTFLMPDGLAFPTTERPIQISAIGGHPFRSLAYKQKLTIFSTSLYEINQALGVGEQAKKPQELDLKDYVPAEYHEFLPLFSETLAKNLPPYGPYDHKIPLPRRIHASFRPAIFNVQNQVADIKGMARGEFVQGIH